MRTNDLNPGVDYCSLQSFIVALYRKQKVSAEVATLSDLRWYYFLKQQSESHKMSPTYGALHEKILHSLITALQWKSAHLPEPPFPDLEEYSWTWNDDCQVYDAVMTKLLPVPETITELTVCSCKTGCKINRCKCKKNEDLNCTETCKCENCENRNSGDMINVHDHLIEENDDDI